MLGTGLKNGILVLIIILILHFIIKNKVIDNIHAMMNQKMTQHAAIDVDVDVDVDAEEEDVIVNAPCVIAPKTKNNGRSIPDLDYPQLVPHEDVKLNDKDNFQELYDFVFTDGTNGAEEFNAFFEESRTLGNVEGLVSNDESILCDESNVDKKFCSDKLEISKHFKEKSKIGGHDASNGDGNDRYSVLFNYDNENVLNGGKINVPGGKITGFDGFDTSYQTL